MSDSSAKSFQERLVANVVSRDTVQLTAMEQRVLRCGQDLRPMDFVCLALTENGQRFDLRVKISERVVERAAAMHVVYATRIAVGLDSLRNAP